MSKGEILKKAIEKAVKNGYNIPYEYSQTQAYNTTTKEFEVVPTLISVNDIIFSHDFAKAFWGDEGDPFEGNTWQQHLQQMVLSEDPIFYLEQFL